MSDVLISRSEAQGAPIPIILVGENGLEGLSPAIRGLAQWHDFAGKPGQVLLAPGPDGRLQTVVAGIGPDPMALRGLPAKLPPGDYSLEGEADGGDPAQRVIAFGLGAYRFDRYRPVLTAKARLVAPDAVDLEAARAVVDACALARDMVNTPANDMGPLQIETIAREVAETYAAAVAVVAGDDLLAANYPAIHAVGRAAVSQRAPRIIEITWGDPTHPSLVLVGKGIVFDTGGLDLKPSSGMRNMKKDMGGAAHALALGQMVMAAALPVRLTILLPVAENAVAGDAMRPGDILQTRKGLTVEIGNTDAEGRLVLADALTRAAELEPDLTLDLATLTGAARAALGPQVVPFYTDDDGLAAQLAAASTALSDPLWRMPLWRPYDDAIEGDITDLKNDPDAWAQAGSVTAALFLQRFAPTTGAWVHLDIFAWNSRGRPGWPSGGEAQAIRALMAVLEQRYRN